MKLGVIAGNKLFPLLFSKSAKEKDSNIELIAICFYGETSSAITRYVDRCYWLHVGELKKLVDIIHKENIKQMVMVGQISPQRIFEKKYWDDKMLRLADDIKDFRPHTVFLRVIRTLEIMGVEFLDSTLYMEEYLAEEGLMNSLEPRREVWEDINFGVEIISRFVDLDVGQSVVVKNKSVVALEALEGTDNTIIRGYKIAGRGCVVLKFSKKDHDLRFDVPVVGLNTLKVIRRVKASALVLEKGKVIILDKKKFLNKAHHLNLPVIGREKTNTVG